MADGAYLVMVDWSVVQGLRRAMIASHKNSGVGHVVAGVNVAQQVEL